MILIGVVSIFLIFNSFKIKSQNKSKDYPKPSGISNYKEAKGNKKPGAELETDKFSTKNFYYPPLQPTLKEPEYQGELLPIASTEAKYKQNFIDKNMLPPGSAILTSAGDLGNSGIEAIIHLATRSVDSKNEEFQPRGYFVRSIQQAILLAEREGYKSIAFPLVDIKTLDLILPPEMYGSQAERRSRLAFMVMKAAFSQARNCKKLKKIVFVDYGDKVFLSV